MKLIRSQDYYGFWVDIYKEDDGTFTGMNREILFLTANHYYELEVIVRFRQVIDKRLEEDRVKALLNEKDEKIAELEKENIFLRQVLNNK